MYWNGRFICYRELLLKLEKGKDSAKRFSCINELLTNVPKKGSALTPLREK